MNPGLDSAIITLAVIVLALILILLVINLVRKLDGFSFELRRINQEIHRTKGRERQYWKEKKRRLWLSLLPFYRR